MPLSQNFPAIPTLPTQRPQLTVAHAATLHPTVAFAATTHQLANGLTLYLSPHAAEPRIHCEIAVRAGSKHDPERSTGLAHYLEHMLFKGTTKLGTRDWAAEEPLLQQIAETYEQHRNAEDPAERTALYKRIDELSQQAAAFAIPGEYDRIVAQMGARGTNAYTWVDQTVFTNDIPSGELERWMKLESERFSRLVLRLFHTELETVFEEFNISQDRDARKVSRAANEALFSPHPYGTHTTIGRGEHLRAPSHFDIYEFFKSRYVPANMAVVLAGDFNPAEALRFAETTFGTWLPRPVPAYTSVAISAPVAAEREVLGQEAEGLALHWRLPGAGDASSDTAGLISGMLSNSQAGLFDLELVRAQRVLAASAGLATMEEHTMLRCSVQPRPGQTLEEARELVFEQINRLASGSYPSWLREAVVVDYELATIRTAESNRGRAAALTSSFVHAVPLEDALGKINRLREVTDAQVQAFAKTHLSPDACVTVFKRQAEDAEVMKVAQPAITPVPLLTHDVSGFAERLLAVAPAQTEARFAKLDEEVTQLPVRIGVDLHHLANDENRLFELLRVFEFGTRDDRWIGLATKYLGYLGTNRQTLSEVQIDFYRLGLEWQVHATPRRTYIGVSGLDAHIPEGLALLDELMRECQPDQQRWDTMVDDIAQKRRNRRGDKQIVLRQAMNQYARYGESSPLLTSPREAELRELDPLLLAERIHGLADTRQTVFYYGPREAVEVADLLERGANGHEVAPRIAPQSPRLPLRKTQGDEVLFVHFPMVQAEVLMLRHLRSAFSAEAWALSEWFNQYYGVGLSSVVFQELRESRALAYSTYAYSETPRRAQGHHYLQAFLGTQPDKLIGGIEALRTLLSDWQLDDVAAERVREGMLEQMRSERDLRQSRYWLWRQGSDRGLKGNQREWLYQRLSRATPSELRGYFEELATGATTTLVLGNREHVSLDDLAKFGQVRELTLDEVFGLEEVAD